MDPVGWLRRVDPDGWLGPEDPVGRPGGRRRYVPSRADGTQRIYGDGDFLRTMTDSEEFESKVDRVSEKYGLHSMDQELAARWTRSVDRFSLRDLAEYYNVRVLESAMDGADITPLDGDAENVYRLLTDDDVSRGNRTQAERHLERNGIDADELTADFVSYQTINRHLKNVLEVEYPDDDEPVDPETAAQRIFALGNRTKAVTENTIDQLRSRGDVADGDYQVLVDISVTCYRCGQQSSVREFVDRNGCRCDEGGG